MPPIGRSLRCRCADNALDRNCRIQLSLTALRHSYSTPQPGRAQAQQTPLTKEPADGPEFLAHRRAPFPADSGTDAAARPRAAGDGHADHRPSRAGIRQARQAAPRRHQDDLQDHQSGDHLHRDRHRRLGSRARQHAVARRPRADGRDRPVRHAVEEDGREARPQAGIHRDRLAHGADPKAIEAQAARGQEQRDQGGLRPAQRDLDRLPLADRGDPQGDRRAPAIRRC